MNQEIFKVADKQITTWSIASSVELYGDSIAGKEIISKRLIALLTLIDGAYDIVEIWNTETSQYNAEWKKQWLKAARECGAQPSP